MGFLGELLTVVPKQERDGIRLNAVTYWVLEPVSDASRFLRALPGLLPEGCTLYVEGTMDRVVREFLEARPADRPVAVAVGTIWPRPDRNHIALNQENIDGLADLVDVARVAYLSTHVHAYRNETILLEWYDAFSDDPIRLAAELAEDRVACFARAIGSSYRRKSAG